MKEVLAGNDGDAYVSYVRATRPTMAILGVCAPDELASKDKFLCQAAPGEDAVALQHFLNARSRVVAGLIEGGWRTMLEWRTQTQRAWSVLAERGALVPLGRAPRMANVYVQSCAGDWRWWAPVQPDDVGELGTAALEEGIFASPSGGSKPTRMILETRLACNGGALLLDATRAVKLLAKEFGSTDARHIPLMQTLRMLARSSRLGDDDELHSLSLMPRCWGCPNAAIFVKDPRDGALYLTHQSSIELFRQDVGKTAWLKVPDQYGWLPCTCFACVMPNHGGGDARCTRETYVPIERRALPMRCRVCLHKLLPPAGRCNCSAPPMLKRFRRPSEQDEAIAKRTPQQVRNATLAILFSRDDDDDDDATM